MARHGEGWGPLNTKQRLDEKHYFEKHIPLGGRIMAALGVKRSEVVKVSGSVPGFTAPYQFVFSVYFVC